MILVSSSLDRSSVFADGHDGDLGEQTRIVKYAEHSPCMLLGFFFTHESLSGTRNQFGSYEIDPVIGHEILLSNVNGENLILQ